MYTNEFDLVYRFIVGKCVEFHWMFLYTFHSFPLHNIVMNCFKRVHVAVPRFFSLPKQHPTIGFCVLIKLEWKICGMEQIFIVD